MTTSSSKGVRQNAVVQDNAFQTSKIARVLVHISRDLCNGLCLLSLFDDATSGALFQEAVLFASQNEVLQRPKLA